jgi:hypothetical protein
MIKDYVDFPLGNIHANTRSIILHIDPPFSSFPASKVGSKVDPYVKVSVVPGDALKNPGHTVATQVN